MAILSGCSSLDKQPLHRDEKRDEGGAVGRDVQQTQGRPIQGERTPSARERTDEGQRREEQERHLLVCAGRRRKASRHPCLRPEHAS